ncbi:MAG TPA: rhomboid family intramembrane serine protease, partial [Tepidisphaeraceae bacterium]|nr:rhomboid family intramembrane serine protease [Tepidisphaeraceae bacterium]
TANREPRTANREPRTANHCYMLRVMFKRQRTGSVVCASCGSLVGVNDEQCYSCGRRNPGLWGFGPLLRHLGADFGFVPFVIYGCVTLYALSLLLTIKEGGNIMGGGLFSMLAPGGYATMMLGVSGAYPVFAYGRWWTVLSAGWLHGSALHILFNMMWVRDLGPPVAEMYGGARMVMIYTISSACGFLLSSTAGYLLPGVPFLGGAPYTLGASAAIFGLLGALVHYGRRGGSSMIRTHAMSYAVSMFVFGLIMPGIDNYAHAGGFVGGYLTSVWLDPLKPERVNHIVGALVCLGATVLAIVASIVSTYRLT